MIAYYAHPLSLYGTKQEKRDVELIVDLGFECLNPNAEEHQIEYAKSGMEYFSQLVARSNLLVFRSFFDGSIPAGIAKEIDAARSLGLPVIELPSCVERRVLTVAQTVAALKEGGQR